MAEPNMPREWVLQLPAEADRWVRQGLISDEQRAAILRLYPDADAGGRDRTILIFTLLGSLLVGAGVVLFFAANWPVLPAALKVGAILVAMVGAYGSGYYLQYVRGDYPRLGHSLIFLGSLLYGAGVWLVAQIFHLDTNYPTGFFLWGLGVLPVVLATGSVPVLYLATLVLSIWNLSAQSSLISYNPLFPLVMGAAVVPLARRSRSALAEAAALGALFLWFGFGAVSHLASTNGAPELSIIARCLLVYGAAVLTAGLANLGDERAYLGLGGTMALFGTFLLTIRFSETATVPSLLAGSAFQTAGLGVMLAALAGVAWFVWRRQSSARWDLPAAALVPVLAALLAHAVGPVPRMVVFNLLLFVGTVGFIVLGVRRRNQVVVNLGLCMFVLHVLTRYFDLFFSAMNKSLFFVMGGVLLLGGGWLLERNRRRWMQDWGGGDRVR